MFINLMLDLTVNLLHVTGLLSTCYQEFLRTAYQRLFLRITYLLYILIYLFSTIRVISLIKNHGDHFDLTFWRSMTHSTAVVEQNVESEYLKYVKTHDYQLVLTVPLES